MALTSELESKNSCARVQLIQTCKIPGESEIFLKGKIKGKLPEMDSILEPFEGYMSEKHVIIPKSIIKSNNSEVVFSVLNPTPETVILKKNAYVASLEPITEIYQQETQASTDVRQDNHRLLTTDLPDHPYEKFHPDLRRNVGEI